MTPEFQNNFQFSFPRQGLEGAIFFKNTGTTPGFNIDENGEVYETFIDPYTIVDVSLTKYFWKKQVALGVGVKNLFDVVNIQTTSLDGSIHTAGGNEIPYGIGRYFYGTMRFKLFKE
jgi:outer membrane receptor for ferrienterochelin and colicins